MYGVYLLDASVCRWACDGGLYGTGVSLSTAVGGRVKGTSHGGAIFPPCAWPARWPRLVALDVLSPPPPSPRHALTIDT